MTTPGYLESVYEEALCVELTLRAIPFARQVPVAVGHKGHPVGQGRLDIVVDERLVIELKAVEGIAPIHVAQVLSYLKATGLRLGLLHRVQRHGPSAWHQARHSHALNLARLAPWRLVPAKRDFHPSRLSFNTSNDAADSIASPRAIL